MFAVNLLDVVNALSLVSVKNDVAVHLGVSDSLMKQ